MYEYARINIMASFNFLRLQNWYPIKFCCSRPSVRSKSLCNEPIACLQKWKRLFLQDAIHAIACGSENMAAEAFGGVNLLSVTEEEQMRVRMIEYNIIEPTI